MRLQNLGGRVKIDTRKSDILRATGIRGDVELKGRGRDIELEDIAGMVTINGSYSGETSLRKLARGVRFQSSMTEFRVERVPGELQLSLSTLTGHNLVGPVMVKAKSKDVRLTEVTDSINLDIDRGDGFPPGKTAPKTRGSAPAISNWRCLRSQSPLNATTRRGEITNDFDQRSRWKKENNGATLAGTLAPGRRSQPGRLICQDRSGRSGGGGGARAAQAVETVDPGGPPRADNQ